MSIVACSDDPQKIPDAAVVDAKVSTVDAGGLDGGTGADGGTADAGP